MYKLNQSGTGIIRKADNAFIPPTEANGDYVEYLSWLAKGNTPEPADPIPLEVQNAPVIAEIQAAESATLRAIREFILGDASAKARLQAADNAIAALRVKVKK